MTATRCRHRLCPLTHRHSWCRFPVAVPAVPEKVGVVLLPSGVSSATVGATSSMTNVAVLLPELPAPSVCVTSTVYCAFAASADSLTDQCPTAHCHSVERLDRRAYRGQLGEDLYRYCCAVRAVAGVGSLCSRGA